MVRLALLASPCVLGAAVLDFASTATDIFPETGVSQAVAVFTARNSGTTAVAVARVEYGCSCTGYQILVDGKEVTAIPASATAAFQLQVNVVGGSQGRQWKSATFHLRNGNGVEEEQILRFSYDTGTAIQLTRKVLYWDIGEEARPKVSTFAVQPSEKPIRITSVRSKNPHFTASLRQIEEGRRYEIEALPSGTAARLIGGIEVETDSAYEGWQSFTVFLLVNKVSP